VRVLLAVADERGCRDRQHPVHLSERVDRRTRLFRVRMRVFLGGRDFIQPVHLSLRVDGRTWRFGVTMRVSLAGNE